MSYSLLLCCDPDRIRTCDRLLRRQMLYPAELPDLPCIVMVGVPGLEPGTSTSQTWRASQLCYTPGAERRGFEPRQRFPVDRLAICCITTLPPLLYLFLKIVLFLAVANVSYEHQFRKFLNENFVTIFYFFC